MSPRIDLDVAAQEIASRRDGWRRRGVAVGETTWREQGEGWPPILKTDRKLVKRADSIGVSLTKDGQEGSVVLFDGGWADLLYWDGKSDETIDEAPGWEDWLDITRFGQLLDRLAELFV